MSYLEPGQILQLGEIIEFQIERIYTNETCDVKNIEDEPCDEHDDVVGEDHVVDHCCVDPGDDAERGEECHHPQPA